MSKRSKISTLPRWYAEEAYKKKLTLADAKFIFDQAEKVLKDSVETSEVIVRRTTTVITVIVALLVTFIGYVILHIHDMKYDNLFFCSGLGIVYLFIIMWYSHTNLKSKTYLINGSFPKDLFNPAFFNKEFDNDIRILLYYTNEIDNYQFKIDENNKMNSYRWNLYNRTLWALIMFPLFLGMTYTLLSLNWL